MHQLLGVVCSASAPMTKHVRNKVLFNVRFQSPYVDCFMKDTSLYSEGEFVSNFLNSIRPNDKDFLHIGLWWFMNQDFVFLFAFMKNFILNFVFDYFYQ